VPRLKKEWSYTSISCLGLRGLFNVDIYRYLYLLYVESITTPLILKKKTSIRMEASLWGINPTYLSIYERYVRQMFGRSVHLFPYLGRPFFWGGGNVDCVCKRHLFGLHLTVLNVCAIIQLCMEAELKCNCRPSHGDKSETLKM